MSIADFYQQQDIDSETNIYTDQHLNDKQFQVNTVFVHHTNHNLCGKDNSCNQLMADSNWLCNRVPVR